MRFLRLLLLLAPWVAGAAVPVADEAAARLIIVANADDADSLRIACHYAEKRGVPAGNIVALPMPAAETITWREFVLSVWQPLQDELVRRRLIDGIAMKASDEAGRRKYAMSGHGLSYLVTCRGVPLRIDHDPALTGAPPLVDQPEFRTNRGAVDSELSLIASGNYNLNGFVRNPCFLGEQPNFESAQIVKVARLDGPTAADVLAMIDRTIAAEHTGLLGRAYVDMGGPHKQGDSWFESVARQLQEQDFDLEVHREGGTFPRSARFDAPALYFGWYATDVTGPFTLPDFRLPPGAIALHIHSYSANSLRTATQAWCGPLVARGASATFGAVYEPYLELMHQPHLLLRRLLQGATLGDAAYYALHCLSWQNVLVGDPLYRPFARSLAAQWAERDKLPVLLQPYVALREIRRLQNANKPEDALTLARSEQKRQPSLAVGVALAQMLAEAGDRPGAAAALGFARLLPANRSDEWGLLRQAAVMLADNGDAVRAVEVYRNLFNAQALPDDLRLAWLRDAARTANVANNLNQAVVWQRQILDLETPGAKAPEGSQGGH
ncbi:MAG: TIGR03790 family protein [Opitutaceae bacterium]|nr:TIGR03790 family protein [Opitutaceae bacterium]